jgi:adenine-specific DNA-methyltransferase
MLDDIDLYMTRPLKQESSAHSAGKVGISSRKVSTDAVKTSLSGVASNTQELTLEDAAAYAAQHLHMPFEIRDISALIELNLITNLGEKSASEARLRAEEIACYGVLVDWSPDDPSTETLLTGHGRHGSALPRPRTSRGWIVLTITPEAWISISTLEFRPYECQLFLKEFRAVSELPKAAPSVRPTFVVQAGNVYFRSTSAELAQLAANLWRSVSSRADEPSDVERRLTLSIYGVKTRLLPLVTSVIRTVSPEGTDICDLMCGSGIVTRKLARTHRVYANDSNAYGPVLAVALTSAIDAGQIESIIERLKIRAAENVAALENFFAPHLTREIELLHTARTSHTIEQYDAFCAEVPSFFGNTRDNTASLPDGHARLRNLITVRRSNPRAFPFVLATAYWANIHFGLRQCLLLDSLRYALEPEPTPLKEVLLAALMQAALICASGPHFAQPFKPRGLQQFKALVEKRSRRLDAEFFSILFRYATLPKATHSLSAASRQDWREALSGFCSSVRGRAVVYVDPPYTPVQYSRYYHVLNVLAEYDYPECSGPGRCPVRSYRFSSRFEFKAGPARRELQELVSACATAGVDLVMSYSRSGAITVRDILTMLREHYTQVDIFQASIRHHAQGKAPPPGRLETIEFVLVAQEARISVRRMQ